MRGYGEVSMCGIERSCTEQSKVVSNYSKNRFNRNAEKLKNSDNT